MLPELAKLGVTAGQKILVRRAPKAFTQELRDQAPPETLVSTRFTTTAQYDVIFYFAPPDEDFDTFFGEMEKALKPDGSLWVIIPNQKGAKKLGFTYDWDGMQTAALKTSLVDNKTLAFSPDEYGTRFVIRKQSRK